MERKEFEAFLFECASAFAFDIGRSRSPAASIIRDFMAFFTKSEVYFMEGKSSDSVRIFRAFGDDSRIQILNLLKTGEKSATQLLQNLDISQSTLSHHMKILCDSGVVEGRREGKWIYYSISRSGREAAARRLSELTCSLQRIF